MSVCTIQRLLTNHKYCSVLWRKNNHLKNVKKYTLKKQCSQGEIYQSIKTEIYCNLQVVYTKLYLIVTAYK